MQYRYEYLCPASDGSAGGTSSDYSIPISLIPMPALVVDEQTLCFKEANAEALGLYGYSRDELMGLTFSDLYVTGGVAPIQKLVREKIGQADAPGGIWRQKRKDGSEFTASIAGKRILYAGKPACLIFPVNIGEYAVPARRKSTREQAILNALPDLVFETDLAGHIYSFHSGQKENLLRPESEFIGKLVREIVSEDLFETTMVALNEANEKGHSTGHQYQVTLPGRDTPSYFEYSVARMETKKGASPRFIVVSRDITARKKAEL